MNKKAQAAMEFMMTYGWAILAVLLVIGALVGLGLTNPDTWATETCQIDTQIQCLDHAGTTSQIQMSIENNLGNAMEDLNVTLVEADADGNDVACTVGSPDLANGDKTSVTCSDTYSTGKLNTEVQLDYVNADSGISHKKVGKMVVKIN